MKKLILASVIIFFFACKKDKNKPMPEVTSPQGTPSTLPPSNYKRVKTLKQYDTTASFIKKIATYNYEYSYTSGLLHKETLADSTLNNSSVVTTIKIYSYTSFGKIQTFTTSTSSGTFVTRYTYDSLSHNVLKELRISVPNLDTTITTSFFHAGNQTYNTVSYGTNSTSYTYINGDLDKFYLTGPTFSNLLAYQATYDGVLMDKSKKNFYETSPLNSAGKLLLSENYPPSPFTTTGYSVTYMYTNDSEGYPTAYENSKGLKWRVYYY